MILSTFSVSAPLVRRTLGAVATAGVLLAVPFGLAGTATAAPAPPVPAEHPVAATSHDWDAVAQCESSGNWATNTGNGFYGGLQFTESTWSAYGGSGNPAAASKAEQIRVAENVLAGQGPAAWPVCGTSL